MGIVSKAVGGFLLFVLLLTIGVETVVGIQTGDAGFAVLIVMQLLFVLGLLALLGWALRLLRSVVQYLIK